MTKINWYHNIIINCKTLGKSVGKMYVCDHNCILNTRKKVIRITLTNYYHFPHHLLP